MERKIHIIVVAAGSGRRFGSTLPKQFCMLENKPVLCHTIERMLSAIPEAHLLTVVSADMIDYWKELASMHDTPTGDIIVGGDTRWASVKKALTSIATTAGKDDIVLVHDGARPLPSIATIHAVVNESAPGASVIPVVPVTDSLRHLNHDGYTSTAVNRSEYRAVTTPQGFILSYLLKAYTLPYTVEFTDDASVMAAAGFTQTLLVDSNTSNIKITNPGDLALAAWYMKSDTE